MSLIASEIVSIQPMTFPNLQLYFIEPTYSRPSVTFFEEEELYAYDKILQSYLGKDYPKYSPKNGRP